MLIAELASSSGPFPSLAGSHLSAAAFAAAHDPHSPNPNQPQPDQGSDEEDDWEDLPGDGLNKSELLAYGGEDSDDEGGAGMGRTRERDDETQRYLVGWFEGVVRGDAEGWARIAAELTTEERARIEAVVVGAAGGGQGLGLGV